MVFTLEFVIIFMSHFHVVDFKKLYIHNYLGRKNRIYKFVSKVFFCIDNVAKLAVTDKVISHATKRKDSNIFQ